MEKKLALRPSHRAPSCSWCVESLAGSAEFRWAQVVLDLGETTDSTRCASIQRGMPLVSVVIWSIPSCSSNEAMFMIGPGDDGLQRIFGRVDAGGQGEPAGRHRHGEDGDPVQRQAASPAGRRAPGSASTVDFSRSKSGSIEAIEQHQRIVVGLIEPRRRRPGSCRRTPSFIATGTATSAFTSLRISRRHCSTSTLVTLASCNR